MTTIEQIWDKDVFSKLACTKEGSIQKISFLDFLWKNVESFFGGINYADKRLVAFYALKLLQNTENDVLQKQMEKVIQIAKKTSLLPQDYRVKPKNVEELTQKIACYILPKYQLPSPVSFQKLSYLYGKKLESFQLLERVKTENAPEDFMIKPIPLNWKRIAVVSFLTLAAVPVSFALYNIFHPDPITSLAMDRVHDMPEGLYEYLKTECIRSIGSLQLLDPFESIQEVSMLWIASISMNPKPPILCEATVKHRKCSLIQNRYSNQDQTQHSASPWVYNGILSKNLSVEETLHPMIQWLLRRYNASQTQNDELIFQTQVNCIPIESELYSDGSKWE